MKKTALLLFMALVGHFVQAQTIVSTSPANKNLVLEVFTGINCYYCPDGQRIAEALLDSNTSRAVLINYHSGLFARPSNNQIDYRTTAGTVLDSFAQISSYPAGMLNRRNIVGQVQVAGGYAVSRQNWIAQSNNLLAEASPVNIAAAANINVSTNQIQVIVETYYTANAANSTNKLYVALLQDKLWGEQNGGAIHHPSATDTMGNYLHRHIFRDFISNAWGNTISSTTTGSFRADTFYYTLPASFNGVAIDPLQVEIAAWVATDSTQILTGAYASKQLSSSNFLAVNIQEVDCLEAFNQVCGTAADFSLRLRNMGTATLNTAKIDYIINGGTSSGTYTHNFGGSGLATGYSELLTLPTIMGLDQATNSLDFTVTLLNGLPNPSILATNYSVNQAQRVATDTSNAVFIIRFDSYPLDTKWSLVDETLDSIISSGGNFSAPNISVTDSFNLMDGHCYTLKVTDEFGDGICCGYGPGFYTLKVAGQTIFTGGQFAYTDGLRFTWVYNPFAAVGHLQLLDIDWVLFPNPAQDFVNIQLNTEQSGQAELVVLNSLGQQVLAPQVVELQKGGTANMTLATDQLTNGVYWVSLRKANQVLTKRLVIWKP